MILILFFLFFSQTLAAPVDLQSLLLQAEGQLLRSQRTGDISVHVAYHKAHLEHYGAIIDSFIGPRPWFEVKSEPYEWHDYPEGHETIITLHRLPTSEYDSILESISRRQFPSDCSQQRLRVSMRTGFDSFGNTFYNYDNDASQAHFAVYMPYINDPPTKSTNFLDPGYCPHIHNKFECAFLRPTNCSIPHLESQHMFYSNATLSAKAITKQEFEHKKSNNHDHAKIIESSVYGGLAEQDGPSKLTRRERRAYPTLFTYGFLFRLNYDFRGRVALETKRFENTAKNVSSITFPKNGNCVTINIRKDPDRAPLHIQNISAYCKDCALGHTTCSVAHFHNYGCNTANPYGSISLSDFVRGAKVISNATFFYVTTDNAKWLTEALGNFTVPKGYTILPYSAPPNHRKSASASGVQYLASLLQARKCNAFVGNSGSAVTALYMNLLCVQHGDIFGGKCPPFFDFAYRHNVKNFDDAWRKLPKL